MEHELSKLMQELEDAIHESVYESPHVNAILGEIEQAGYDVMLVLESTIRFSPKTGCADTPEPVTVSAGNMQLTAQDEEFLQALQIAI
jgi:hypothetical protein